MAKARQIRQDPGDELLRDASEPGVVSIDQARSDHPDEWILLKVTAFDENHAPSRGKIIAHESSHERIWEIFAQLVSPGEKPDTPYYIFQAGQPIRSGAEMRRVLAEAAEQGAAGAWREW